MTCLLPPVWSHLPFYNLMSGCSGMVNSQYGASYYWWVCQSQVNDPLSFVVVCCPTVGGPAVIPTLRSVLICHAFAHSSIALHLPSWVALFAVGGEVSCKDSATLPNDCPPVDLSHRSLSLSRLHFILIINIDNPGHHFTSSPDLRRDNIFVGPP